MSGSGPGVGGAAADIEFRAVGKRYGDVEILHNASFTAPRGTVTGLIGPNGAGKSTILRIALGLVSADRGEVRFGGSVIDQTDRAAIGVLLEPAAHPGFTVERNLAIRARRLGVSNKLVRRVLARLELEALARRRVGKLSLGQRQRVALALAFLSQPQILILDEPTNGLDPSGVVWLRGYLKDLARNGSTVLVSSHGLAELDTYVENVVLLNRTVRWTGDRAEMQRHGFANVESLFFDAAGSLA